jgi:hypothetical protein
VIGSIARHFGTDLAQIFLITNALFVAIVLCFWCYAAQLLPGGLVLPVVLCGFVLAVSTATLDSAALPLGMYNPAVPVGFLCLIAALCVSIRCAESGGPWRAAVLGGLAGLCILAKQDFWLPALCLALGVCTIRWLSADRRSSLMILLGFVITFGAGMTIVAAKIGIATLPGVATGFGHSEAGLARTLPSWKLVVIELTAAALVGVGVFSSFVVTGVRVRRGALVVTGLLIALIGCLLL